MYHIAILVNIGPPHFLAHLISHTVTVGMTVTLYCNVSGYQVSYVWEKSGDGNVWSRISNTQSYKYEVKNIQQSQQYRCIAGNPAGSRIFNVATIQVLSKYNYIIATFLNLKIMRYSEIVTHPHNERSKVGSSVTLTCRSSISSADIMILWTRNGTTIRHHQVAFSTLTISNVRYRDAGSYACIVAKGSLSVTSNTAIITVYSKLNTITYYVISITI